MSFRVSEQNVTSSLHGWFPVGCFSKQPQKHMGVPTSTEPHIVLGVDSACRSTIVLANSRRFLLAVRWLSTLGEEVRWFSVLMAF